MRGYSLFPPLFARLGQAPDRPADLSSQEMERAMGALRDGTISRAQAGAFLMALRMKVLTASELFGALVAWQQGLRTIETTGPVLHLAPGFSGQMRTIDLTLPASLVAAAAGARVLLMGSESQPPHYGLTPRDLLQALGIQTGLHPGDVEASLATLGWAYGYFPQFHPRFARLLAIRKELGVETMLDPLEQMLAPAGVRCMLVSTASPSQALAMADVLKTFGTEHGGVVLHPQNTTDLALDQVNQVFLVQGGNVLPRAISAQQYGIDPLPLPAPAGLTLRDLAALTEELLSGQPHPYRPAVQFNAAWLLTAAGVSPDLHDGLRRAEDALRAGIPLRLMREFRTNYAVK